MACRPSQRFDRLVPDRHGGAHYPDPAHSARREENRMCRAARRRAENTLAAPPVDGKANAALIEFVAVRLDLPKSAVSLKSGQTSRRKVLEIVGVTEARINELAT
jgi:uncharacterized protein YggU (UPF0235/DUF167 family)